MRKLCPLNFLLIVGHVARLCLSLSYLLPPGFFIFASCRNYFFLSMSFSEESIPYVAVGSMCPWEVVCSESSSVAVLNQSFYLQHRQLCILYKSGPVGKSQLS